MSDLKKIIEDINKQISTVANSFVSYDKSTGKIFKISSKKETHEDLECVEVETDLVKDMIVGKRKTDDFIVKYDLSEKRFTVKEITYETEENTIKNKLYEIPNQKIYEPIYSGIFVDVWYNELEHLEGQHVWFENAVYRINSKQSANTNFDKNNAEKIIDNIRLFDDENQYLNFERSLDIGTKFLKYNRLYMITKVKEDYDIKIVQDHNQKNWKIHLSPKTHKKLLENYIGNDALYLSITEKNDPNILYKMIIINLRELIENKLIEFPFENTWEIANKEVSIYTPKFFDSYIYEVTH